jgi:hypothetical protein
MRVEVTDSGCWEWQGYLDRDGYGHDGKGGAHRSAYVAKFGPVPPGMQLDHLCRNRRCVNPDHLEPVTHRENQRRGIHGMKTVCKNGHPYDEANTYYRPPAANGQRDCRKCAVQRTQRYRARKAA